MIIITRGSYEIGKRKVAIIGTGFVGASITYALTLRNIAREVVLIDINSEKAQGEALDIRHGIPYLGTTDVYAGDYSDCADCDLIIITCGRNRQPGESRLDLAVENTRSMKAVTDEIKRHYTRGVILVITNPVDILTQKVSEWMELPNGMVFGSGCMLDTSRFIRSIADYVGLSTGVINGFVVGEHGDAQVPIWSRVTVGGLAIAEYCENALLPWDDSVRSTIAQNVKRMGAEIIRTKGKTHYGIATCVCNLANAILNQAPTIASVCSPLQGEQGVLDVSLSVPSVIGANGVQQRLRERWSPEEYRAFFDAVENVRQVLKTVD